MADPSPADIETAKASFVAGLELREHKDLEGALVRFRAAYALVPSPITALELGRTLIAADRVLEGREIMLEASRMQKKPGESEQAEQARTEAAQEAEAARAKLASLTVDTDFGANPILTIDDQPVPKDAARVPRFVDPGHHVIMVSAKSHHGRAELDLLPGEQRQIRVDADQPNAVASPAQRHLGSLFWVGAIGAGASLVLGTGVGLGAFITAGNVKSECPNHQCPPTAQGDLDASLALGWISTFAFVATGVFTVLGVVGFVTAPRSVTVGMGPGSVWLRGNF